MNIVKKTMSPFSEKKKESSISKVILPGKEQKRENKEEFVAKI